MISMQHGGFKGNAPHGGSPCSDASVKISSMAVARLGKRNEKAIYIKISCPEPCREKSELGCSQSRPRNLDLTRFLNLEMPRS